MHSLIFDWWELKIAILALCAMWCIVGYLLCQATHKQRGIEVDRPITDNLPTPPQPVVVPDTPEELFDELRNV